MFKKNVDTTNREEMIQFLKNHFRYNTANSWNRMSSYANNMKIYNLDLSPEEKDRLYDFLDVENAYDDVHSLISSFTKNHNYLWTAGFNGRQSGYLVLYRSELKDTEYRSFCTACGQRNYKTVEETGSPSCGRCGKPTRINYKNPPMTLCVMPSSVDQYEDFEEWSDEELRERVCLITDFDKLCDDIVDCARDLVNNHSIVEEEYYEIRTKKVLA